MRTRLATLTLLASALAATGCGGGSNSTSTPSQASATSQTSSTATTATQAAASSATTLIARIETICARRNSAIAALAARIETQSEVKHATQKHAAVEQATLAELNKLTVPASMEPAWKQFIDHRQALIKALLTLGKDGLTSRTEASLQTVGTSEEKMRAAAKHDGLKECSRAGFENLSQ